jgi:LexA-binding, inner membrane-associated putative hydrolase
MILGHYGLALAAKRAAPRPSLGTFAFAAQWLDELWPILVLAGLERVRVAPGLMAANPLDFEYYPYSHSLAAAIVWSVLLGGIYYGLRRDRQSAGIIGLLVLSHWILDLPMHRPDLQLWPGSAMRVGLGAWRSIPLTIVLELMVFGFGLVVYLRTTRARDRIGSWAFWAMVAVLVLIFVSGFTSAPPPNGRAVALGALGLWLFVPWSYWIDRHRELIEPGSALHESPPRAAADAPRFPSSRRP